MTADGVRWRRLALIIGVTLAFCAIATFTLVVLTQGQLAERGNRRSAPHSEHRSLRWLADDRGRLLLSSWKLLSARRDELSSRGGELAFA